MNAEDGAPELSLVVGRGLGTVVVTVGGDVNRAGCELLEGVLIDLIEGQGNVTVAVDLGEAIFEPEALMVFITAASTARRQGTRFVLKEPSADAHEALLSTGHGDLVEVQPRRASVGNPTAARHWLPRPHRLAGESLPVRHRGRNDGTAARTTRVTPKSDAAHTTKETSSARGRPGCPVCGLDGGPPDAERMATVLRLLPAGYRALVGEVGDDRAIRRHVDDSWSTLECVVHVVDVLQRITLLMPRIMADPSSTVESVDIEAPRASANAADCEAMLVSLGLACDRLACIVEDRAPAEWLVVATCGRRRVTTWELAWEAVHEGTHHLACAQQALHPMPVDTIT